MTALAIPPGLFLSQAAPLRMETQMDITIIHQNGGVYRVYDHFGYASDECKRLAKAFPWFDWHITQTVAQLVPDHLRARHA